MKFRYNLLIFAVVFLFGLIVGIFIRDQYHFSSHEQEQQKAKSEYEHKLTQKEQAIQEQEQKLSALQSSTGNTALEKELAQLKVEKANLELAQEQKKRKELEQELTELKKGEKVNQLVKEKIEKIRAELAESELRRLMSVIEKLKSKMFITSEQEARFKEGFEKLAREQAQEYKIRFDESGYTASGTVPEAVVERQKRHEELFKEILSNSQHLEYRAFLKTEQQQERLRSIEHTLIDVLQTLEEKLSLTKEQKQKIRTTLEEYLKDHEVQQKDFNVEGSIVTNLKLKENMFFDPQCEGIIKGQLIGEQSAKFDQFIHELEESIKKGFEQK